MTGRTILIALLVILAVLLLAPFLWMTGMMGMMMAPGLGGGWMLLIPLGMLGVFVLLSVLIASRGTRPER